MSQWSDALTFDAIPGSHVAATNVCRGVVWWCLGKIRWKLVSKKPKAAR